MSLLFLGTCRLQAPADVLAGRGLPAVRTSHRFHSPHQVRQYVEHSAKVRVNYDERVYHLLSDFAMERVLDGRSDEIGYQLLKAQRAWQTHTAFAVEISSLTEFFVTRQARTMYVNTFTARDLQHHRSQLAVLQALGAIDEVATPERIKLTTGQVLDAMRSIKACVQGRPIVWVSHMRPAAGNPAHDGVIGVRSHLANVVANNAEVLGDTFFDPSEIAAELGTDRFFLDAATDLDHLSLEAAEMLADRYWDIAWQLGVRPLPAHA